MSDCIICKKDMPGLGGSVHDYAIVEEFLGDYTIVGEICDSCGEKIIAGKITNVIEAAVAFMDQLNSFNDFNHPEIQKHALELQKAVGGLYAKERY